MNYLFGAIGLMLLMIITLIIIGLFKFAEDLGSDLTEMGKVVDSLIDLRVKTAERNAKLLAVINKEYPMSTTVPHTKKSARKKVGRKKVGRKKIGQKKGGK